METLDQMVALEWWYVLHVQNGGMVLLMPGVTHYDSFANNSKKCKFLQIIAWFGHFLSSPIRASRSQLSAIFSAA